MRRKYNILLHICFAETKPISFFDMFLITSNIFNLD